MLEQVKFFADFVQRTTVLFLFRMLALTCSCIASTWKKNYVLCESNWHVWISSMCMPYTETSQTMKSSNSLLYRVIAVKVFLPDVVVRFHPRLDSRTIPKTEHVFEQGDGWRHWWFMRHRKSSFFHIGSYHHHLAFTVKIEVTIVNEFLRYLTRWCAGWYFFCMIKHFLIRWISVLCGIFYTISY